MTLVLLWNMPALGVEEKQKPKARALARPVSRLVYQPEEVRDRTDAPRPPVWMALAWEFLNE